MIPGPPCHLAGDGAGDVLGGVAGSELCPTADKCKDGFLFHNEILPPDFFRSSADHKFLALKQRNSCILLHLVLTCLTAIHTGNLCQVNILTRISFQICSSILWIFFKLSFYFLHLFCFYIYFP